MNLSIDSDYITSFIEKYTLYLNEHLGKKTIHKLENGSQNQKNLMTVINRGESTNDLYIGTWYKLDIAKDPEKFDALIIQSNLHKKGILDNQNFIDLCLKLNLFNKDRLGYIKRVSELKENKLSPEEIENNIKVLEKHTIIIE